MITTVNGYTSAQVASMNLVNFVKLVITCAENFASLGGMSALNEFAYIAPNAEAFETSTINLAYLDCVNCCDFASAKRSRLTFDLIKLTVTHFHY